MISSGAGAEETGLKQQLIGTWRMAAYTAERDDGDAIYPLGQDLQGYIMYAADGHMSVNLMKPGRPKFSSGDIMRSTAEERAAAAEGYFAYAGTYEIDEAKKMVVHHVEYSLYPNWVGMDQHRLVILEGNRLELRSPKPVVVSGEQRTLRVRWERTR
jgi:hypothetical protein